MNTTTTTTTTAFPCIPTEKRKSVVSTSGDGLHQKKPAKNQTQFPFRPKTAKRGVL